MYITVSEMNETMAAYREWKRVKEEAEANMDALKIKAIELLNETEECEAVDKKGTPIRKFIGTMFKVTHSRLSYMVEHWDAWEFRKIACRHSVNWYGDWIYGC